MHPWRELLIGAYQTFHVTAEGMRDEFPKLVPYEASKRAAEIQGSVAWWWAAESEIRETINSANSWATQLGQWQVWQRVLASYPEDDQWEIEHHLVFTLASFCMFQPSAFAERLLEVTENVLHQANRSLYPDEKDSLNQDNLKPGQRFTLAMRRKQVDRLGARWTKYRAFRDLWTQLDGKGYRRLSKNFRNLSSHSIAPRLGFGETTRAVRSIVPRSDLVRQDDGSYLEVEHPTLKSVQYAMAIVAPLPLDRAYSVNRREYELARSTMIAFADLLDELVRAAEAGLPA